MNLVFTICSINYLASAKCLWESVTQTNPDVKFVYVIADKISKSFDRNYFENADVVEVEQLGIPKLHELIQTYNIIEFNTAIKPFAIRYFAEKYHAKKMIYLDPDILVFDSLQPVFDQLSTHDFILTPHILTPVTKDEFYNQQKGALNTGVFNLGFIAVGYNKESEKVIDWWAQHMRNHGHCSSAAGEFYDQKIMNLLPVFSDKVLIEKNPGYNVAGWNIHERTITKKHKQYLVNGSPLLFYHYSGFVEDRFKNLISAYNHLKADSNPHIADLLELYRTGLAKNNHARLLKIKCYYDLKPNIHRTSRSQMLRYKLKQYFK